MIYYANDKNNYLQHYGVLGMKWGHHRYKVNIKKAKNAKNSGDLASAKKYEDKAKKIRSKHERLSGGKKAYDYTAKQSIGKTILKSMLMGTYGTMNYNKARAKGNDKIGSYGHAFVSNLLNGVSLGTAQYIEPRVSNPKRH